MTIGLSYKKLTIVLLMVVAVLISILLTVFGFSDEYQGAMAFLWGIIVTVIVLIITSSLKTNVDAGFYLLAYIARIGYMLYRYGFSNWRSKVSSDASGFWSVAVRYYNGDFRSNYGGGISHIYNIEFHIFGQNVLCCVLINILLCMLAIYCFFLIVYSLDITEKSKFYAEMMACVLPYGIMTSCSLYREALYVFLLTFSFYFFFKYILSRNKWYYYLAVISVVIVLIFHIGYFPFIIVYCIFNYKIYPPKKKSELVAMIFETMTMLGLVILIRHFNSMNYIGGTTGNPLVNAINTLTNGGEISEDVGSAYLRNVHIVSIPTLVLYWPLKLFFYLFSPLPVNWRGISDILAFGLDGFIHIVYFVLYFRCRRIIKDSNKVDISSMICNMGFWIILLSSAVFCLGTIAAGTAIRHRDATIQIEAVVLCICVSNIQLYYGGIESNGY